MTQETTGETETGFVAFGFGPDDMAHVAGDSFYSVAAESAIEVQENATFSEISEIWYRKMAQDWMADESLVAEFIDEWLTKERLSGFWVVKDTILEQLDEFWTMMDPRSDGQTYACNRAAKLMVRVQATRTVMDG